MGLKLLYAGFETCFGPNTQGALGSDIKTHLHTPTAVTYHEQSQYCRFMIGHSLGRMAGQRLRPIMNNHSTVGSW